MHTKYRYLVGACVMWAVFPICASAQSATASVSGRVLDQNSAAILGATIGLQQNGSSHEKSVTTDEAGLFRFDYLSPGDYHLVAKHSAFSTFEKVITLGGSVNP